MYAVANNGTLVYAESPGGRRLVWIDRDGREEFVKADERMYSQLRLSPDGTRVATARHLPDGDRGLWVIGLDGSSAAEGAAEGGCRCGRLMGPRFSSPPPTAISTGLRPTGPPARKRFSGSPSRIGSHPLSITPDGKYLLTGWDILPKRQDLRLLQLGATPQLKPLIGQSGTEGDARVSPDGKWIVYQSAESTGGGRDGQIIVRPFPNVDAYRRIISPGVGSQPIWSHDGREIFYRTEDGSVMSVAIKVTPTPPYLIHDPPVRVMSPVNTLREWASGPTYDVSPDGRVFSSSRHRSSTSGRSTSSSTGTSR